MIETMAIAARTTIMTITAMMIFFFISITSFHRMSASNAQNFTVSGAWVKELNVAVAFLK